MKLSTKCRYGTRALIEIARKNDKKPVKRKDIRDAQGISPGYLENILSVLRVHNFVRTIRGAGGGFVLDKEPKDITLLDIVLALDGSVSPVDCVVKPEVCERVATCAARKGWEKLYISVRDTLKGITLQDLVALQIEKEGAEYSI